MPSLRSEFAAMVRHHRTRQALTQAELAEKIGKTVETVGKIERGEAGASFETLQALSRALRTPVRDFFGSGSRSASGEKTDILGAVVNKLAVLPPEELVWINSLIDVALGKPKKR